ncbi:probable E3 ubiquitin-protein ligase ZFP1 [Daucus carota subsp. sativus]|uniref:probable E3 ubiquitin-protein ligase ZFP1 n=1 Tax=Daucus carota subsp. sativus TaxID=79200 RepID=UPI003082FB10
MGRSDDREAEVLLLSNEMQNPNLRDAAAISTRIPTLPDLNMLPLDLNMPPSTEEELEEEEDRDHHMATHESEIQNPRPHVGEANAAVSISTWVSPIIDLNLYPLDLNMPPTQEEENGQPRDHRAMHVFQNNHPSHHIHSPQEEVSRTPRALDPQLQLQLLFRLLNSHFQQMGRVDSSRLPEGTIMQHLQIRYCNIATTTSPSQERPDICVICQDEYAAEELVGGLRCGHEYHVQCIRQWLRRINKCPICRATAI